MPEVSVIIPVHKVESWLCQCLDSVLTQTFNDFELILVDDGSPDACGAICDEYADRDSRIHVIHQKNAGPGNARNVGMDQACGKYIIFLDSDDYWLPLTLEILYSNAEQNQTQVLAFGALPFWEGIKEPESHLTYQQTVQNGIVKSGPASLKTALDAGEYYSAPCLRLYLHEYLRSTGLRFDEGIIHEDVSFSFLAYLMAERVECIGDRLYQRRFRPDSIMTGISILNSSHGYRVALDDLLDTYDNYTLSPLGKEQLERYIVKGVRTISHLYDKAIGQKQNGWYTAKCIQMDWRQTLKRAQTLPSMSRSHRLLGCSLLLDRFVSNTGKKLSRMISKAGKE